MLALRFAGLLALVLWVGGLAALGGLALPATFDVLQELQAANGRAVAGQVAGEILGRFHVASYVCAAVVMLSLALRAVLGPRPRQFAVRLAIATAMAAATLYSGLVVSPRIEQLRQDSGGSPSALAADHPTRAEFGRLHGTSTALQMVPLLGGLALMIWELRD